MTMIARARGMVALVSQTLSEWIVLFSSSSAFYHLRIHLAPSRLSRRQGKKWRSRNQNRSWKLKMLILSQMPIPQTVLSILSYLSISIAIYWKLTNSLNTLHSSQFNRVHLVEKQITKISVQQSLRQYELLLDVCVGNSPKANIFKKKTLELQLSNVKL